MTFVLYKYYFIITSITTSYPTSLAEVCSNGDTLSNCIKKFYVSDGINELYYHDGQGTYTNADREVGDYSYRYSGANPNNYVCFGSTASTCPNDNLYRIIGVFSNQVKLIKADFTTSSQTGSNGTYNGIITYDTSNYMGNMSVNTIASYYWDKSGLNAWENSELNTINLNTMFLSNFSSTYINKIAVSKWYTVELRTNVVAAKTIFNQESTGDYINASIGLMYVSDYGYSVIPDAWNLRVSDYNDFVDNNWLFMGIQEWFISKSQNSSGFAYSINDSGYPSITPIALGYLALRPCFYLNSNVTYNRGSGTSSDPIRIN